MTKTHVIDGVTYVEVDRKARIGDKIIIVNEDMGDDQYENGDILTVIERYQFQHSGVYVEGIDGLGIRDYEYHVLEPKPTPTLEELLAKITPENRHEEVFVDTTQASPEVIDLLANLARRLTSVETQLRSTQRNLETTAEELANARHRIRKHEDRFAAVEDKVEMLTDDVVTLDSRSQVLNAINKYYAEGSR